jgi:branched-chain amino acid transport system substrate-binding protein
MSLIWRETCGVNRYLLLSNGLNRLNVQDCNTRVFLVIKMSFWFTILIRTVIPLYGDYMTLRLPLILTITLLLRVAVAGAEDQIVKIGWIGPLSGNAAVLGVDTVPAMQLVIDSINDAGGVHGHRLKLIAEDDQYSSAKTVSAYNRLVHQEGIKVIVALTYGGLFSIAQNAEKDGVLLIDPLDCDDKIAALPANTLCITKRTEDLGRANAEHAISQNAFPAGILYFDGDPFMGVAADATKKTLQEHGKDWTFIETYNEGTTDFRTLMLKAKQANLKSLFFYGYDQMGTAMKEARSIKMTSLFYTLATSTSPDFQHLAGEALEGTFFPNWNAPRRDKFAKFSKDFQAKVGREPHMEISTVPSYDIAQLIVAGLNSGALDSTGNVNINTLRAYLYNVKNYDGVSGTITVDSDGITRSFPVTERVWKNGKAELAQ